MPDNDGFGVNLARGGRPIAGLTREQREAHNRMASLPRTVHRKVERDVSEARSRGAQMLSQQNKARGIRGPSISFAGSRPAKKEET